MKIKLLKKFNYIKGDQFSDQNIVQIDVELNEKRILFNKILKSITKYFKVSLIIFSNFFYSFFIIEFSKMFRTQFI